MLEKDDAFLFYNQETYECLVDKNDRWNGWYKPKFTKEVVKQIIEDLGFTIINEQENEIVVRNEFGKHIITKTGEHWEWGSGCWCWMLKSDYNFTSEDLNEDERLQNS